MTARGLRILGIGFAALIVVVAAAAWFVTSEYGLRWALQRASELAGGRLVIEEVKRTGIGALTAGRVRYRDGDLQVEARDVVLSMSAGSLLRGRPIVHALHLGELRVDPGPGSGASAQLPHSLRSPTPFVVEALRVDRLTWIRDEQAIGARKLALALDYDGRHYALSLRSLETPWLAASGSMRLGADAPFPIEGRFTLLPVDARIGQVSLALAGELTAVGIGAVGSAYGAPVEVKASLFPFHSSAAATVDVRVEGLAARAIAAAAPAARLDVLLDASIDRDGRATGRLRALNREPGLIAAQKLPLVSVDARFTGGGLAWRFESLAIDAGAAGALAGSASLAPHGLSAELQVRALDLRALHPRLYATALSGPLRVESDWRELVLHTSFAQPGVRLALDAVLRPGRLELRQASWSGVAGTIEARGSMTTARPYALQASGRLSKLDPSRLGDYPSAELNGVFEATGGLEPMDIGVVLDVAASRFRGQPLAAGARARITPERITGVDVAARLGSAHANVQGQFGAVGDVLRWRIEVPDLRMVHDEAAGRLHGAGAVSGRWREPAFDFEIDAGGLRFGERLRAGRLSGKGRLAEGLAGRVDLTAEVQTFRIGELNLDHARVVLEGSRDRHRARLQSAGGGYQFEANVAGALDRSLAWQGAVESLELRGPVAGRLEQPIEVMLSASAARVGPARVQIGPGLLELASFAWQAPGRLATRGTMSRIALASLQPLLPVPAALRALVIGARWDVDAAESLNGSLQLVRETGDVVVPGSPPLPARLRSAALDVRARSSEVGLDARIDSEAFGTATARLTTRASLRDGAWGIAGDAPVDANISARMPSIAWVRAVLQDAASLDGEVRLDMRVSGSVREPAYSGEVSGRDLKVAIPELGLTLTEGNLAARLQGRQLTVTAMRFASGAGEITGTGGASLVSGNITARLELTAKQLTVLSRPDRLVVVSGQAAVHWDPKQLRAEGKLSVDRGLIELPPEDTPRPSSDVVVAGSTSRADPGVGIEADLLFDLGKDFRLQGRGVSTRLTGTLRVQLAPKRAPVVTGTVRTLDGTYAAYGQKLTIQRGTLTFAGPVENPALDILAVRKTNAVEVGVAVGGTALLPQVRLVSTPPMSDADKLAWLTLGRGLDQVSGNEAAVMQAAAMALLSRRGSGSGAQRTFANRFGLDELSVSKTPTTGEQIVTLGKRFTSNVYLGVERGVTGAVSVVKVTYDLSRRWSVQGRAGSENAVDLFYTLNFR